MSSVHPVGSRWKIYWHTRNEKCLCIYFLKKKKKTYPLSFEKAKTKDGYIILTVLLWHCFACLIVTLFWLSYCVFFKAICILFFFSFTTHASHNLFPLQRLYFFVRVYFKCSVHLAKIMWTLILPSAMRLIITIVILMRKKKKKYQQSNNCAKSWGDPVLPLWNAHNNKLSYVNCHSDEDEKKLTYKIQVAKMVTLTFLILCLEPEAFHSNAWLLRGVSLHTGRICR